MIVVIFSHHMEQINIRSPFLKEKNSRQIDSLCSTVRIQKSQPSPQSISLSQERLRIIPRHSQSIRSRSRLNVFERIITAHSRVASTPLWTWLAVSLTSGPAAACFRATLPQMPLLCDNNLDRCFCVVVAALIYNDNRQIIVIPDYTQMTNTIPNFTRFQTQSLTVNSKSYIIYLEVGRPLLPNILFFSLYGAVKWQDKELSSGHPSALINRLDDESFSDLSGGD